MKDEPITRAGHPSSFILHPSSFILHLSSFIFHPFVSPCPTAAGSSPPCGDACPALASTAASPGNIRGRRRSDPPSSSTHRRARGAVRIHPSRPPTVFRPPVGAAHPR